jgi:hypothetical protein
MSSPPWRKIPACCAADTAIGCWCCTRGALPPWRSRPAARSSNRRPVLLPASFRLDVQSRFGGGHSRARRAAARSLRVAGTCRIAHGRLGSEVANRKDSCRDHARGHPPICNRAARGGRGHPLPATEFQGLRQGVRRDGEDRATAVFSVSQEEAVAAVAEDDSVYEELWRAAGAKVFIGLRVDLTQLSKEQVREPVEQAWRNKEPKRPVVAYDAQRVEATSGHAAVRADRRARHTAAYGGQPMPAHADERAPRPSRVRGAVRCRRPRATVTRRCR